MKNFHLLILTIFLLIIGLMTGCHSPKIQPRENTHYYNGENLDLQRLTTITNGHASQGTAIYKDTLFICNKHGHCYMYQLPNGEAITDFPLASYDNSDTPHQNHCNQMMFGPQKFAKNDPFPLLYITTGYSGNHDSTGAYYAKCSIERILYSKEKGWYTEIVQTIAFNDEENIPDKNIDGKLTEMYQDGRFWYATGNGYYSSSKYQKIGYGWPHFYIDSAPTKDTIDKLYIFSSRFCGSDLGESVIQENYEFTDDSLNHYILTEFDLPKLPKNTASPSYGDTITLYPKDITNQFETEFDIYAFQGGTMYNGKIYHSFGYGNLNPREHNGIRVFDIAERKITAKLDLSDTEMALWEPECCCIYNGELVLSAYNMNKMNKTVNLYILKGILEK